MINIYSYIHKARKDNDKLKLSVYQNLLAEMQKYETSKNAEFLTGAKQIELFNKYAKSLEDSITQFREAGRDDLVSQYTNELDIVKEFLPEPIDESEVRNFIEISLKFAGRKIPKKEFGISIKYLKSNFPTADGKMLSTILKDYVE